MTRVAHAKARELPSKTHHGRNCGLPPTPVSDELTERLAATRAFVHLQESHAQARGCGLCFCFFALLALLLSWRAICMSVVWALRSRTEGEQRSTCKAINIDERVADLDTKEIGRSGFVVFDHWLEATFQHERIGPSPQLGSTDYSGLGKITLCQDRLVSSTTLTEELLHACLAVNGLDMDGLKRLVLQGFDAAFVPGGFAAKIALRAAAAAEYDEAYAAWKPRVCPERI